MDEYEKALQEAREAAAKGEALDISGEEAEDAEAPVGNFSPFELPQWNRVESPEDFNKKITDVFSDAIDLLGQRIRTGACEDSLIRQALDLGLKRNIGLETPEDIRNKAKATWQEDMEAEDAQKEENEEDYAPDEAFRFQS